VWWSDGSKRPWPCFAANFRDIAAGVGSNAGPVGRAGPHLPLPIAGRPPVCTGQIALPGVGRRRTVCFAHSLWSRTHQGSTEDQSSKLACASGQAPLQQRCHWPATPQGLAAGLPALRGGVRSGGSGSPQSRIGCRRASPNTAAHRSRKSFAAWTGDGLGRERPERRQCRNPSRPRSARQKFANYNSPIMLVLGFRVLP